MAVVVWVFAGGGEAEVRGLIPFLEKNFTACRFVRMTPVKMKPGPRPGAQRRQPAYGHTGSALADQIQFQLTHALKQPPKCELLLVVDDLDCHDPAPRTAMFQKVFESFENLLEIPRIVGFAAPEIEAWLIADWEDTFARDIDLRGQHAAMRWWLASKGVPFDAPESFGNFDAARDACDQKLSDLIIESSQQAQGMTRYSKATHTPRMLTALRIDAVANKCPHFRHIFASLRGCV